MNLPYGLKRMKQWKAYVIVRDIYYKGRKKGAELQARHCYLRKLEVRKLDDIIKESLAYVESLRVGENGYLFSKSAQKPALFNAVYAVLIKGIAGISILDQSKWKNYFDSFQEDDGIWRDHSSLFRCWDNRSEEWNDIHIIPHIIYAYEAIGALPKKRFAFLDKFADINYTKKFCDSINFEDFWGESNGIMNYLVSMLYARDAMKEHRFDEAIAYICNYLVKSEFYQNGLWTKTNDDESLYGAIRGGLSRMVIADARGHPIEE